MKDYPSGPEGLDIMWIIYNQLNESINAYIEELENDDAAQNNIAMVCPECGRRGTIAKAKCSKCGLNMADHLRESYETQRREALRQYNLDIMQQEKRESGEYQHEEVIFDITKYNKRSD
ncbi:MAG: hypothetical protein FWC67_05175 [Defluviitaleaceae bacterium]|nr:hypothetical protein [Defluviitaleaceae bacterium]